LRFAGFQKTSLIDYPDRVASILFTSGCTMRCPFCHNGDLVHEYTGPFLEEDEIMDTLFERKRYVDAVVVTGGEPTLQPDLPQFIAKLKESGFNVKLDTNGLQPEMLKECLLYLDYIAIDIKTSPSRYSELGAIDVSQLIESVELGMSSGVDYEFRCTAVPGLVEADTIPEMGELVKGAKLFVFQQYRPEKTLDPAYGNIQPHSDEVIQSFAKTMENYVDTVMTRI
jgi:pyruvate formate lyase activating enzyme